MSWRRWISGWAGFRLPWLYVVVVFFGAGALGACRSRTYLLIELRGEGRVSWLRLTLTDVVGRLGSEPKDYTLGNDNALPGEVVAALPDDFRGLLRVRADAQVDG